MSELPQFLSDTGALERFCAHLAPYDAVAVDTEFLRERTYYPRLCLLQIATPDAVACIDPLVLDNLDAVARVLRDPAVVKVLHSAKQDLEVLSQTFGAVPAPVFDTQVAAAFSGLGDQIGYAALVQAVLDVHLPKSETRTRWCARPLSPEQLQYAADDVRYLPRLYRELTARLRGKGNLEWALEDMQALEDPGQYCTEPATAYRRLAAGSSLPAAEQHVLRSLAEWRERVAQAKNLPREWIVGDSELVHIARAAPGSLSALRAIPALPQRRVERWGRELLVAANPTASPTPDTELWPARTKLSPEQRTLEKHLRQLVERKAASLGVPVSLLARRADLKALATGREDVPVVGGWRLGVIGAELQAAVRQDAESIDASVR